MLMEFNGGPFDQYEDEDEGEGFTVIDQIIGDLAMGEQVIIFVDGIINAENRSLIEDLREAGAEVIVPSDN